MSDRISTDLAQTHSPWIETGPVQRFPQLERDVHADVAIIGGGITGLTTADLLKRAGKRVVLIDFGRIGHGESGHTTAHLTEVLDISYRTLLTNFGMEGAHLACQSSRKAIQRIEANIHNYGIDCHFKRVSGWKFAEKSEDVEALEEEADAAIRLSVPNTVTAQTPLPFPVKRAIRFEHQAQFHPLNYLHGLARTIVGGGSHIFELTRALDIDEGEPCRIFTDHGMITAENIVIAANVPVINKFLLITKIAAYRTYAVAFKANSSFDYDNLFWDVDDPYHYIRSERINQTDYLLVGGEDHKTGKDDHTENHFQRLEIWCRERFQFDRVDYRWSGQIINPVDGLPFIGRNSLSDRVFVATGYMGNGMTFGTVAGMLLSDLILEQSNPWAELYDARRVKPWVAARNFLHENADYPTHLITDRLAPAQEAHLESVTENSGRIVRVGSKKVAAYRDPEGQMHLLSPVCSHLGCYVHWNEAEKSWDCPCHGSRFDPYGKLLNGPAVTDLKPESYEENPPYATERYENRPELTIEPLGPPLLGLLSCPLSPTPPT